MNQNKIQNKKVKLDSGFLFPSMSRFFAIFFRHISIYIFSRENRCFTIEFGILVSTAKGTGDKQRVPRHPNNQLIKTNSLVLTMNSLFENYGLAPIAIQIISYLDVKSFLKVRGVNKTLLILIDNEQSLWRKALKNLLRSGPAEESEQEEMPLCTKYIYILVL